MQWLSMKNNRKDDPTQTVKLIKMKMKTTTGSNDVMTLLNSRGKHKVKASGLTL